MYYKLSNTVAREEIEETFELPFKYPNLHEPQAVIFGLNEVTIPVITIENTTEISLAIWGILPNGFTGDWAIFQSVTNTLNLLQATVGDNEWHGDAFRNRRCLIIVNGFFTTLLKDGKIQPYHVSQQDRQPFLLAGLYNQTDDGFLSCSLLLGKAKGAIQKHQNLSNQMPLIIKKNRMNRWLDKNTELDELNHLLNNTPHKGFNILPIGTELLKTDTSYPSLLEPILL